MLYMLVFSLGFGWRLCFGDPYNQHIHPCDPIPDLDLSTCQGLCRGCRAKATLFPDTRSTTNVPFNVLQNRPSRVSAVWICIYGNEVDCSCKDGADWRQLQACGANNGLIDKFLSTDCLKNPYNCVHSADVRNLDAAWWFADMEKPVSVVNIVIYAFSPYSGYFQIPSMYESMAGIRFYVDAKRCTETAKTIKEASIGFAGFKFPNKSKFGPGIRFVYWCKGAVKRGRYFRIQKLPDAEWSNLQFCEAQVFACPSGTSALEGQWQERGTYSCKPCSCSQYPCDNYYGCNPDKAAQMATSIIIQKHVEVLNSERRRPAEFLVDGVPEPADFRCYRSLYSRPDQSRHFARIDFENLYQVIKVHVVNFAGYNSFYTQFQVWTARQDKKELCFQMDGVFGDVLDGDCTSCSTGLNDCPRATSATFQDGGNSDYLALCELELYGFPMKEITRGGPCGDCQLELCAKGLQCEERICKAKIGDPCSKDVECQSPGICEGQRCKLPLNGDCSQLPNMCASGLECFTSMCKLILNSGPCNSSDDCTQYKDVDNSLCPYVCDYAKKCRRPEHSTCNLAEECAAGAVCASRSCSCTSKSKTQTIETVMSGQKGTCGPIYFNKSCQADNACGGIPHYECKNGICVCQDGFVLNERDFFCSVDVGQPCNAKKRALCSESMVCEDNTCRIGVGTECNPSKTNECTKNTVCDKLRRRCLYKYGETCQSSGLCQTGSSCDSKTKRCIIARGEECHDSQAAFCGAGLICAVPAGAGDAVQKCVQAIGNACEKDEHCPKGTICEQGFCMVDILETCNSSTPCRESAECIQGQCVWKIGSTCSRGRSECGPDAVCGFDERCRYKFDKNCTQFPAFCQLRSVCNENKKCKCLSIALKTSDTCELSNSSSLVTSKCELTRTGNGTLPCAEARYAKCDPKTKTCVCNNDYASTAQLECRPAVGFPCTFVDQNSSAANQDRRCAEHAVCENNVCRLPVGQVCVGRERLYCVSGAFCDRDSLCRLTVGSKCGNELSNYCELRSVCDQFQKCKLPTGTACTINTSCVVGAKCKNQAGDSYNCKCDNDLSSPFTSTQGLCVINSGLVGGACYLASACKDLNAVCIDANTCKCKEGFEVSEIDLSCKVGEGFPCRDNNNCTFGNVCDRMLLACKRALGSSCSISKTNSTNCETGTVCDDSVCRIPDGGSCASEEMRVHCMLGTVCDLLGVCKKSFNYRCNASYECGAGMICLHNTCSCNKVATQLSSGLCSPLRGRIGSSCSPTSSVGQCTVQGSFCDDNTGSCQCQYTAIISQDLTCVVPASKKDDERPDGLWIFFIFLAFILLVCILLAIVYRVKGAKKKDHVMQEMEERQQRIRDLKAGVDDFQSRDQLPDAPSVVIAPLDKGISSHPESLGIGP